MQSPSILLVYGTSYGHTQKIVEHMASTIRRHGGHPTTVPGNEVPDGFEPRIYDGVIIAASIIGGKHQRYIERFIKRHLDWLQHVPSAFFSVSGSAGSPQSEVQQEAHRLAESFVSNLGWRPAVLETIAGEIAYTRYWFGLRFIMRMIAKGQGGPTDTSRDIDLTDWMQVDRLALDVLTRVQGATQAPASPVGA
jgi:menaquinone-dependent protoporphyrinogen oxidase